MESQLHTYTLGALRSPVERIAAASTYAPRVINVPTTLDLRIQLRPVRNQGSQGACVAFASTCVIEYFARKHNNDRVYFSPQFIYNCRSYPGEGMYISNALDILRTYGVPLERTYKYGKVQTRENIPASIFVEARGWRIKSAAIVQTIGALKSALINNGPCIIAFPVYNYDAKFWHRKELEELKGGHAVTVVGYTLTGFIIRNSWGSDWNDNGHTEYPFAEWGSHWEVWTIVDMPPHPNVEDDGIVCCNCIIT